MRFALVVAIAACGRAGFDPVASSDGARAMHLFENGFECGMGPWKKTGNVTVVGAPPTPIEGNCMLEAQAQTSTSARGEADLPSTVSSGAFYYRAYYYVPSGYAATDLSIVEVVQAGGNLVMTNSPEIGLYNDFGPGGRSTYALPRDTWTCVEIRVGLGNAPDGTWDVWVDGVLRYSLRGLTTLGGGVYRITAGVTWAGPTQAPATDYVDAVVADTAPIGCL